MKRILTLFLALILALSGCRAEPFKEHPDLRNQICQTASKKSPLPPKQDLPPEFDALALAEELSIEVLVGQIFLARCPDTDAQEVISQYHPGGYILFGQDFKNSTPEALRAAVQSYQERSSVPMLIAVDEEGGTVTRVSYYSQFRSERFPSPRWLYSQGGLPLLLETEREKCGLLSSLGINVNMAPVCDITTDQASFMYSRSLGLSPELTGTVISQMVDTMDSFSIGSVLKHFPGYGNNTDTHTGIAVDDRPLEELEQCDMIPFAEGIRAGCGAILVSHTFVNAIDASTPASLSFKVIHYLTSEMGFDGVVITDDLSMGAITSIYGEGEAAVQAVLAGCDLLCTSSFECQYQAVLDAVQSGRISRERLVHAAAQVLQWKYSLGLLDSLQ